MYKKYKLTDLIEAFDNPLNAGSPASQEVFTNLTERATLQKDLSVVEANYYCQLIDILKPVDPDTPPLHVEDYDVCRNYHFRKLYLQYYNNLNGTEPVYDYKGELIPEQIRQKHIKYLDAFAEAWEEMLAKNNHRDEMLNYVVSEARQELKGLNKLPEVKELIWGANLRRAKRKAIVLHSKYVYITAKEIFESLDQDSISISINNQMIEFNSYSLIHILSRHFAGGVKQYDLNKSYLTSIFHPRELPSQLEWILGAIDASAVYQGQSLDFIPVRYRGQVYSIWTKEAHRSIKGQGNVKYRRLQTLYPTKDPAELQRLSKDFEEMPIYENLSIFIRKSKEQ